MRVKLEERLNWRQWLTPVGLKKRPRHRWCVFPHSFTGDLVYSLIDEWGLTSKDIILDPFAGAGTTILAAKEKGVPATGYDISPFAVHATKTKISNYNLRVLETARLRILSSIHRSNWNGASTEYPALVRRALPGKLLGGFDSIARSIDSIACSERERAFFRLALLRAIPVYSRAAPTGGWLSWVDNRRTSGSLLSTFERQVDEMLYDLRSARLPQSTGWRVGKADARRLPDGKAVYSAVITSPPYPNRHDYTRVFGVELMFGFLDWEATRKLRYQSFESHPEAHPRRPAAGGYTQPTLLTGILERIRSKDTDGRIGKLLSGYFLDMYLSLRETSRVSKRGARIAYVVGNAQYFGVEVPVDVLTAEVGTNAGLTTRKIVVVRYRGNSAQQMGAFGRKRSRESIVLFEKTG